MNTAYAELCKFNDTSSVLGPIPFNSLRWLDELNGVGSGEIEIPLKHAALFEYVDGANTIQFWSRPHWIKIYVDGTLRFTFANEDPEFNWAKSGGDLNNVTVTLKGRGIGLRFEHVIFWPDSVDLSGDGNDRTWLATARASVLISALLECRGRGCLAEWPTTIHQWTHTQDNDGENWVDADDIKVRAGVNYLSALTEWADYGYDWHFEPDFHLGLWKHKGETLTSGANTVVFAIGIHITPKKEQHSFRQIQNVIIGERSMSGWWAINDSASITNYWRRESWQQANDIGSETTQSMQELLNDSKSPSKVREFDLLPNSVEVPYVTFNLGDTVSVKNEIINDVEASRVMAIVGSVGLNREVVWSLGIDSILANRRARWQRDADRSPPDGGGEVGPEPIDEFIDDPGTDFWEVDPDTGTATAEPDPIDPDTGDPYPIPPDIEISTEPGDTPGEGGDVILDSGGDIIEVADGDSYTEVDGDIEEIGDGDNTRETTDPEGVVSDETPDGKIELKDNAQTFVDKRVTPTAVEVARILWSALTSDPSGGDYGLILRLLNGDRIEIDAGTGKRVRLRSPLESEPTEDLELHSEPKMVLNTPNLYGGFSHGDEDSTPSANNLFWKFYYKDTETVGEEEIVADLWIGVFSSDQTLIFESQIFGAVARNEPIVFSFGPTVTVGRSAKWPVKYAGNYTSVVATLDASSATSIVVDILVNGSQVHTLTIAGTSELESDVIDLDLDDGDLVQVEVTDDGDGLAEQLGVLLR